MVPARKTYQWMEHLPPGLRGRVNSRRGSEGMNVHESEYNSKGGECGDAVKRHAMCSLSLVTLVRGDFVRMGGWGVKGGDFLIQHKHALGDGLGAGGGAVYIAGESISVTGPILVTGSYVDLAIIVTAAFSGRGQVRWVARGTEVQGGRVECSRCRKEARAGAPVKARVQVRWVARGTEVHGGRVE
ncbi:hypothetical protein NDU88_004566 [Pleurodeles waltl]|uniref:Uncharacterized protein n=1 Tax=Pleurodeles waltl TaxID=8319 RepID=A0AAV7QG84_PLEWA|nr:hypothetical protein NDU88_004566 [Pleurodeles waltl]